MQIPKVATAFALVSNVQAQAVPVPDSLYSPSFPPPLLLTPALPNSLLAEMIAAMTQRKGHDEKHWEDDHHHEEEEEKEKDSATNTTTETNDDASTDANEKRDDESYMSYVVRQIEDTVRAH
ncbi:hypothetical protein MKZ38_000283 [Zalerion maritima]|uniref:Uncharacterized protein n=1 Tax=Zalerion maritima TaxID=339359 RepID=A0AAD5WU35_9PEZI|nr:hypothetical protein MKZ38_000283 [Zalerion maritima]